MKIGELASRAGCDVQTVRFYEREGLLEAPAREPSGYRRYEDRHLTQLNFVRHLRSLNIQFNYTAKTYPSYLEAYNNVDSFKQFAVGGVQISGRLLFLSHCGRMPPRYLK